MTLFRDLGRALHPGVRPNGRETLTVWPWLELAVAALLVPASIWLLIIASVRENASGSRTLSSFTWLIDPLRGLGNLVERSTGYLLHDSLPWVVTGLLVVAAAATLFFRRRFGKSSWQHDIAISVRFPALIATGIFIGAGLFVPAATTGLLGGWSLLGLKAKGSRSRGYGLLWLFPLGIGTVLRFYALAQIPNGYAEHAAVQHAEFTLRYLAALQQSIQAFRVQPVLGVLDEALLRDHTGPYSLVDAIGFQLFGVSALISRLISAGIGSITIYLAYRLGRALSGEALGLCFSLLLAVSPWHIAVSRYATAEHVLSPLQFILAALFLVRAFNTGRILDALGAAFFVALAWLVYAPNLVVPVIALCLLILWATSHPNGRSRGWKPALAGIVCFAVLSYVLLRQSFPQGLFQPNVRTGYLGSGSLLSDWPRRADMLVEEGNQLFVHANDPWFSLPAGGGLSALESALVIPGVFRALWGLWRRRATNLAWLIVLGIPLAAVPAVLAPDASFRRLMLVALLCALAAALVLASLARSVQATLWPAPAKWMLAVLGVVVLTASSAFTYFDRVTVGEEIQNGWFSELTETAAKSLGRTPVVVVVPHRNNRIDTDRYMRLMAYDTLQAARANGIPQGNLYFVTSCEDPIGAGGHKETYAEPPILVVTEEVKSGAAPCGPTYLARLESHYAGSRLVVTPHTPVLPPDLVPARP